MVDKNPNKAFKRPIDDSPAPEATEIIVKLAKKPMTYTEAQRIYGKAARLRLYNSTREEREDAFNRMNENRDDR
jgi:hypothetical protein